MKKKTTSAISKSQQKLLLEKLESRFNQNSKRHLNLNWQSILDRITSNDSTLFSLLMMEDSGGEPDVIAYDKKTDRYFYVDCATESPSGRRSLCYDREGMLSRKEHLPVTNAMDMAASMGIDLLTEEQYMMLQELGTFDTKTSSWLKTPAEMRKLGGAIFGDRRFNRVFVYHNGAQSYYAGRGFRGGLWI